ncbi:MAG: hypothetical protein KatS3mg131_3468 [Candidatus Tectimicrobiota bacterium]|nr:MAG: hypothetical protein KatS3mg131_3468 [Candidatus Tectomicrobia bacterium]
MDYTAVGNTTHVAARLQSLAAPGTILMTQATQRLVEGYVRSEPLGTVAVKGRREPVAVYRVSGRQPRRSRLDVRRAQGLTPLVGRTRELGVLQDCLARARAGHGQVVGIVGAAGVGKSRLLYEFRRTLSGEALAWLEGHCFAHEHSTPYLPILELLRATLHIEEAAPLAQVAEKLRQGLRQLHPRLEEVYPVLADLLGVAAAEAVAPLHPRLKQWRTFEALRAVTAAASQRCPHVLVIEDVHWLDKASAAYLAFLGDSLAGMPVLLLATYRPGAAVPWATRPHCTPLALDRLPPPEVEALLDALLGPDASLAPLAQLLHARSDGNPFFLEESVRMLAESGVLAGTPGAYRLTAPVQALRVPPTVQALLAARLDRLPEADKRLLQTAAVIGRHVPQALLAAVSEQPETALRQGLARLRAAEFLYETRLFPEPEYAFTHALVHEVAYASLLQAHRRTLHARTVAAVEALYPERLGEWRDRLAYHVVRGEVWHKAPAYFRPTLQSTAASLDASFWWTGEHARALDMARHELAVAAEFKNFALQVGANFSLVQAYHALGDYARAAALCRRHVALLTGDLQQERFALPGLAAVLFRTWLAWCLAEQGEFAEGCSCGEAAVALAAAHPFSRVVAACGLGTLALRQGEGERAAAVLEPALSGTQAANLKPLLPLVAAPLGAAYALAGRHAEAVALLEEAVARAEAMQFAGLQAGRLVALGEAYQLAGQHAAAQDAARRALALACHHGERGHEAWAWCLLGDLASAEAEALAAYHRALALAEALGMRPLQAHSYHRLGRLHLRQGQRDRACEALGAARTRYRTLAMAHWLPQVEAALAALS